MSILGRAGSVSGTIGQRLNLWAILIGAHEFRSTLLPPVDVALWVIHDHRIEKSGFQAGCGNHQNR
jgi:hypothetical protein